MNKMNRILINCLGILGIFVASIVVRLPSLINADYSFGYDEAFMAVAILELMNGAPIFFNYEGVSYHGVLGGLTAIPFMKFLGVEPLAYQLPAVLYYSLYVWSTYLLAKIIIPSMAFLVVVLMVIPPPEILGITMNNWPHTEVAFLGNIIFLLFINIKTNNRRSAKDFFILALLMGFSIYVYTYSILHIFSVLILFILSHKQWGNLRPSISLQGLKNIFKNLSTTSQVLARVIDVVIVFFCCGIIFSYIFGGFGLDIAGYSILQINQLHKPVFQLAGLMVIRLIIRCDDVVIIFQSFSKWRQSISPGFRRFVSFGIFGFLIGLSPRIIPIVTGDIKRGGAGFDMDFFPTRLIDHLLILVLEKVPKFIGVYRPLFDWFEGGFFELIPLITGFFAFIVVGVILWSTLGLLASRKAELIKISKLYPIDFHPTLILLIFSAILFISLVVTQHGPLVRYLFPMFGIWVIWVVIKLEKIKRISIVAFYVLVVIWVGFYTSIILNNYKQGKMRGMEIVRLPAHPLNAVVEFLRFKNIRVAYTSYYISSRLTFMSKGDVVGTEYNRNARGKKQQSRSAKQERFADLLSMDETSSLSIFQQYLFDEKIEFKTEPIKSFNVLWGFKGNSAAINGLRSLING
jgi:hypothetical protein